MLGTELWSPAGLSLGAKAYRRLGRRGLAEFGAEVVQNSTSHLTDTDLQAMAEYLKSIPANSNLRTPRKLPDDKRMEIAALYLDHCSGCHQSQGRGIPGTFPPLAGNGVVLARNPANIITVVLSGIPAQGKYAPMPSFASGASRRKISPTCRRTPSPAT